MQSHQPTPRSVTGNGPSQFFKYHGVMAPGVRLFRSMGFPGKATWVSMAFVIPIVLLVMALGTTVLDSIAFSSKELDGARYGRSVKALIDVAQQWRRASTAQAPDADALRAQVDMAFQQVTAQDAQFGTAFDTTKALNKMRQHLTQLHQQSVLATPLQTFDAHTALIKETIALLQDVADGSNLTLDPDLDTFYLMNLVMFEQPALVESVAQLRGLGNAVLRSGTLSAEQRDRISAQLAFARARQENIERAFARVTKATGEQAQSLDGERVLAASRDFMERAREQVLGATLSTDADGYLAAGNAAVAAHVKLSARATDLLSDLLAHRVSHLKRQLTWQLSLCAASIVFAVYLLIAFYRVTQGGIAEVARHLGELSRGNLTGRPRPWGRDEVASLMNTLNDTLGALRGIVERARNGSREIEIASIEVASASMDLSRRTDESAAHLQRTASAMEQISRQVQEASRTATGAAEIVAANARDASRGRSVADSAVQTMQGIGESSGRIAEIIGVIDGIAFQTNILALNAAVEAARAGEQGRGFAVVAAEVRALAQRTANAAHEIKDLIVSSVDRIGGGTRVVDEAGATMQHIATNAERIHSLINEIATGASDQTAALTDIADAVQKLDASTQQNAALVEQTAATAENLKEGAKRLREDVAFFVLPQDAAAATS